jgi:hypothetical protein
MASAVGEEHDGGAGGGSVGGGLDQDLMVNGLVAWAATLWDTAYYRTNEELAAVERAADQGQQRQKRMSGGGGADHLPNARKVAAQVEEVARLLCRYQYLDANLSDPQCKTEAVAVYEQLSSLAIDPEQRAEESVERLEMRIKQEHTRLSKRLKRIVTANMRMQREAAASSSSSSSSTKAQQRHQQQQQHEAAR